MHDIKTKILYTYNIFQQPSMIHIESQFYMAMLYSLLYCRSLTAGANIQTYCMENGGQN